MPLSMFLWLYSHKGRTALILVGVLVFAAALYWNTHSVHIRRFYRVGDVYIGFSAVNRRYPYDRYSGYSFYVTYEDEDIISFWKVWRK